VSDATKAVLNVDSSLIAEQAWFVGDFDVPARSNTACLKSGENSARTPAGPARAWGDARAVAGAARRGFDIKTSTALCFDE
jgi:hypothetical protein